MEKIEQLTKLNELLKDKVISKEEFDSLKQEVLSGEGDSLNTEKEYVMSDFEREFLNKPRYYPTHIQVKSESPKNGLNLEDIGHEILKSATRSPVLERIIYGKNGRPMND